MINTESPDHVIKCHYIIFRDTPTHQRNPIQHTFRYVTQVFEIGHKNRVPTLHRCCLISFTHLSFSAWFKKNGGMNPNALFPAKGANDLDMQRKGGKPLGASDYMCNFHLMIINDCTEMIRR